MKSIHIRLADHLPLKFEPVIIGLDVIEFPPEQQTLMSEFRARQDEIARAHYAAMDDVGRFCDRPAPRAVEIILAPTAAHISVSEVVDAGVTA